MLTLDAGCGARAYKPRPTGDVNLDVERPIRKIDNFVLGDICYLPFRDEAFDEVHCFHVLEHIPLLNVAVNEVLRVCRHKLFIKVPHPRSANAFKDPNHLWLFDVDWFLDCFQHYWTRVYERKIFFIPLEIVAEVFKSEPGAYGSF